MRMLFQQDACATNNFSQPITSSRRLKGVQWSARSSGALDGDVFILTLQKGNPIANDGSAIEEDFSQKLAIMRGGLETAGANPQNYNGFIPLDESFQVGEVVSVAVNVTGSVIDWSILLVF